MLKKISIFIVFASFFFVLNINLVFAAVNLWGANTQNDLVTAGFEANINPQSTAVSIINLLLTFLGIIAVVLILWAGFLWMTAGGNDDNVGKAKKIMLSAVIGLLIILAAYGIVNWVLSSLNTVV